MPGDPRPRHLHRSLQRRAPAAPPRSPCSVLRMSSTLMAVSWLICLMDNCSFLCCFRVLIRTNVQYDLRRGGRDTRSNEGESSTKDQGSSVSEGGQC